MELRGFFRFCQESGWIQTNPARLLNMPKDAFKQKIPFASEEFEHVLWATLLGNSPAIVMKYYAPWVKSRQESLNLEIEKAWKL